jgi:hypothetical protein
LTACATERVKLVERVPSSDLVRECPKLPSPPTSETDDVTLSIWIAETRLAAQDCAHRHRALVDWALKK